MIMTSNKRPFNHTATARRFCIATLIGLSVGTSAVAATAVEKGHQQPTPLQPAEPAKAAKAAKEKPPAKPADFVPDPAKRLTLENFKRGLDKLHNYLKNAVEKATEASKGEGKGEGKGENKKFLVKEKLEIERQIADPQAAYDELFNSIETENQRLKDLKVFPEVLVAEMYKHYLEVDPVKAMAAMRNESKKEGISDRFLGEMEYQLGIIAQRDQVNYKNALRYFKNAVKHSPSDLDYLIALADVTLIIEDHGEAAKLYQNILTLLKRFSAPADVTRPFEQKLAVSSQRANLVQKNR